MGAMHSSRLDYALRALLELSKRDGSGPTRVQEIATSQNVPARFLEAVLADLRRAGFVESKRGVKGGYWLAMRPEAITVADVVRLVDGDLTLVPSDDGSAGGTARAIGTPAFKSLWKRAAETLEALYGATTFADLLEEDRALSRKAADFSI